MKRVTLPKISSVPNSAVLARLVDQAEANREDLLALPFDGLGDGKFVLAVTFSNSSRNVPRWYLFAGDTDGAPIVWMRETANQDEILVILTGSSSTSVNSLATRPKAPPRVSADTLLQPAAFDQAAYYAFFQKLTEPDTSMYPPGAFYWFLSQELVRFQRTKTSFALIMFDCRYAKGPVDKPMLSWIGQLLNSQMRKLDYVCYMEPYIGVLLAASELAEAVACAVRLADLISHKSSARGTGALMVHAGVSAIPETCEHPGVMVTAAEVALKYALAHGKVVTPYEPSMS
jgi:GGDEF domain-containing protein